MKYVRHLIQGIMFLALLFYWLPLTWFLIISVLLGPVYCGWVCPMGFVQDMAIAIRRRFGLRRNFVPTFIDDYAKYLRYVILLLVLATSASVFFEMLVFDPRANLQLMMVKGIINQVVIVSLLVSFILSLLEPRFFCRYLCIEGAKLGSLSVLRVVSIHRNDSSCVHCKKCDRVCPARIEIEKTSSVRSHQCIQCLDCVFECPVEDTLTLTMLGMKKNNK